MSNIFFKTTFLQGGYVRIDIDTKISIIQCIF